MRGLAAVSVLLFHLGRDFLNIEFLYYGKHGVTVFFVISGFVICHALSSKEVTARFIGLFMLRRSIRLDPSYWFCILLALFILWAPASNTRLLSGIAVIVYHWFARALSPRSRSSRAY